MGKTRTSFKPGQSGNPNGRPASPEIAELRAALDKAKKENKKSFLEHFVQRAFRDDTVAIALSRKLLPDKVEADVKGDLIVKFGSGNSILSETETGNIPPK